MMSFNEGMNLFAHIIGSIVRDALGMNATEPLKSQLSNATPEQMAAIRRDTMPIIVEFARLAR